MSYLRRKADAFLTDWKNDNNRKPIIIKGARQVGKTETIRTFAKNNYKNFVEINFVTEPKYKAITENGYSAESIIQLISRIDPSKKFIPNSTLIFFDEIQSFPDIATSLKFFSEDKRFDVICSGSLLGINYKSISSISVGYKTDYQMFSLDFEEYLWALGYNEDVTDSLLNSMLNGVPLSQTEYKTFSDIFLDYCILGGMPAVVKSFVEQKTFEGSLQLQKQLIVDYEGDIRKYAESLDQAKIISVYRSVPAQLAKENKKFQYSKVTSGGRSKEYMGCIEWLEDAGIVNKCQCLSFPELPIKGNTDESRFKLYMADTGLLVASLDEESQVDLRANKNLGVYKGALYENFAAESLTKQGYPLVYYKKENSTLEEDFFIRSANELIPVEVKSNTNKSKSLSGLISSKSYPDIKHGIKLSAGNIGVSDNIYTLPYFTGFLLKRFMSEQKFFN